MYQPKWWFIYLLTDLSALTCKTNYDDYVDYMFKYIFIGCLSVFITCIKKPSCIIFFYLKVQRIQLANFLALVTIVQIFWTNVNILKTDFTGSLWMAHICTRWNFEFICSDVLENHSNWFTFQNFNSPPPMWAMLKIALLIILSIGLTCLCKEAGEQRNTCLAVIVILMQCIREENLIC